ncbi:hypothetical protein APHAL10511_008451 [Amanita phalloides]|nr:hypothetical protein APHAL10511_008451 [Amanita phalloides]
MKFNINDQGFNLIDFYCNIITTFNEHIDYEGNYELDSTTATWIKDTLHWWQINVPGLQRGSANVSGEDSDDSDEEESDLTKLLASRKPKTSDVSIDPALQNSQNPPNSSSAGTSPTLASGVASTPQAPVHSRTPAPTVVVSVPQVLPQAPHSPLAQASGMASTQAPLTPTGSANKQQKQTVTDGPTLIMDEDDLAPLPSPAQKQTKCADPKPAPALRAVRKSTRRTY